MWFSRVIFQVVICASAIHSVQAQQGYTLSQALRLAAENNPQLRSEAMNIGIAQTDIITAGLRPNPILNNQTLQLMQPSYFARNRPWYDGQNQQVWWQLTRPFQVSGQRKNKVDLAQKGVSLAETAFRETAREVYLDVALKWLEVWAAQKQLDIIGQAKGNIDSLTRINEVRLRNQVITQTDLMRTQLLADQYALQLRSARREYENLLLELGFLLGTNEAMEIDTSDRFLFFLPTGLDSVLDRSMEQRSDIQMARSVIDLSASNIRLQRSLAFPQPELGFIWNPQNNIQYLGIYATVDLPFFSRNQGEIKRSYLLRQQSEQQLLNVQGKLRTEVATAHASYFQQQRNVASFSEILSRSETILDNVRYAYLRGGTTIIDLLEAQRSWLETRQQYYDALQGFRQSHIRLLYATGSINELAQ